MEEYDCQGWSDKSIVILHGSFKDEGFTVRKDSTTKDTCGQALSNSQ